MEMAHMAGPLPVIRTAAGTSPILMNGSGVLMKRRGLRVARIFKKPVGPAGNWPVHGLHFGVNRLSRSVR